MLVATSLVFLMTPAGLALFYGGLSNVRNVINTVDMSYVSMCVATLAHPRRTRSGTHRRTRH